MNSIYDHLSPDDRRRVARWRAIASAVAISVLLCLVGVIAALQPHGVDLPTIVTQATSLPAN